MPSEEGFVKKNAWYLAHCPKHGETEHGVVLDGRCFKCQAEKLEAEDKR